MLFTPLALGATELRNRFVMAPLTRCRADQDHTLLVTLLEELAGTSLVGPVD